MARRLRALFALAEVLGYVPSSHMSVYDLMRLQLQGLRWLLLPLMSSCAHIYIHEYKTLKHTQ